MAPIFLFVAYVIFMLVIFIGMMNILIAIVSDSYDDALSRSSKTYWVNRLDLCAETGLVYKLGNWTDGGWFPKRMVPSNAKIQSLINQVLETTMSKQQRQSKGKFADLQYKMMKDSEAKTRRIVRDVKVMMEAQNQVRTPTTLTISHAATASRGLPIATKNSKQRLSSSPT